MTSTPWAILLCKFNDDASEPNSRQFYERLFTQVGNGALNMVDFFSDASANSKIFFLSRHSGMLSSGVERA